MKNKANNDVMEVLSYNISYLRKEYNLTKLNMAKIMGVGIKTLNKVEKGILPAKLTVDFLFRIQKYFNIPVSVIVSKKINENILVNRFLER